MSNISDVEPAVYTVSMMITKPSSQIAAVMSIQKSPSWLLSSLWHAFRSEILLPLINEKLNRLAYCKTYLTVA